MPFSTLQKMCDQFPAAAILGRGAFGTVYEGKLAASHGHMPVAVKMFHQHPLLQEETLFRREMNVMRSCNHPNIVHILAFCCDDVKHFCIVMPLMDAGSLEQILQECRRSGGALSFNLSVSMLLAIFRSLAYLHTGTSDKPVIVHRDVKPDNIFSHSDGSIKLGDLGISLSIGNKKYVKTSPQGTLIYIDPEYYRMHHLRTASDIYSVGIILYQLLMRRDSIHVKENFPGDPSDHVRRFEGRCRQMLEDELLGHAEGWDPNWARNVAEVARSCTASTHGHRKSASSALQQFQVLPVTVGTSAAPRRLCIVCLERPRQGLLRPCGHNVVCRACATKLLNRKQGCPLCRKALASQGFFEGTFNETFPGVSVVSVPCSSSG